MLAPVIGPIDHRASSLSGAIGGTPLVRLRRFEPRAGVEIYAKLESRNPGGSVKDRAALAMIEAAEQSGTLGPGRTLLDATSGNTGIAYAMLGAARGHAVQLCVPANASRERLQVMRIYGADLVLTDPMDGSDGAIREARRLFAHTPDRYAYLDQYSNPANWGAHFATTGVEILDQTGGRVTHFIAGLGTSGTFVGTSRRLRLERPDVRVFSVQPVSPLHGIEGLKHMASAIVPAIYDPMLADANLEVDTETALALTRRLATDEGLFVGPSSGAALAAGLEVSRDLTSGVIVMIFPDGGERYLSDRFWTDTPETPVAREPARPMTPIALDAPLHAAIRAHAERIYPEECCGALIGPARGSVTHTLELDNTSDDARLRRFLVGPDAYRRAEKRAAELGHDLLGFYHSHPDHPAVPSEFDLEHAWPNLSYLIVSVRNGRAAEARSWRLRADRSGFDEEPLHDAV